MTDLPVWRLCTLRAGYLLMAVGLGAVVWPGIIHHDQPWSLMGGVVKCLLGAMGALAVLGVRYPVKMLPLMLFEISWKALWLVVVALPLWRDGTLNGDFQETAMECVMAVLLVAAVPWGYVASAFLVMRSERWA